MDPALQNNLNRVNPAKQKSKHETYESRGPQHKVKHVCPFVFRPMEISGQTYKRSSA